MEPSKAHVINSFFFLYFSPSHTETCKITLYWGKKTKTLRHKKFGVWQKKKSRILLYYTKTPLDVVVFASPHTGMGLPRLFPSLGCCKDFVSLQLFCHWLFLRPGQSLAGSAEICSVPPSRRSLEGDLCHPLALCSQEDGKRASRIFQRTK